MDVMVFQIRFQNILVTEGIFPTLEAGWSTGGCLAPKVLFWEEDNGCMDADCGSDPEGKCGYISHIGDDNVEAHPACRMGCREHRRSHTVDVHRGKRDEA